MNAVRTQLVAITALITFLLVADKLVWDSQVWECTCSHDDCNWCSWPAVLMGETTIDMSWSGYHSDAYNDYADEFTALFNSYETKRASNGVLLIRSGSSGSYRFAKRSI